MWKSFIVDDDDDDDDIVSLCVLKQMAKKYDDVSTFW